MGAEEVPGRLRRRATVAAALCFGLLGIAGCGDDSESDPAPTGSRLGPPAPEGDIVPTSATLRSEEGFSTLVTAQVTTRGERDALIVGQVELSDQEARFRVTVDGDPAREAEVSTVSDGGTETAVVSCACRLPTGQHDIVLEGAPQGESARVGARTLVVFPRIELDRSSGLAVNASALDTRPVAVNAEGATLTEVRLATDEGEGPLVILAAVRSPLAGAGSQNVRMEALVDDEPADELAITSIPSGRIVAYLASDGAEVGDTVSLRGFVTSGRSTVGVSALAVCPCDLAG